MVRVECSHKKQCNRHRLCSYFYHLSCVLSLSCIAFLVHFSEQNTIYPLHLRRKGEWQIRDLRSSFSYLSFLHNCKMTGIVQIVQYVLYYLYRYCTKYTNCEVLYNCTKNIITEQITDDETLFCFLSVFYSVFLLLFVDWS